VIPLFISLMLLLQNPSPAGVAGGVRVSGQVVGLTADSAATIVLRSFERDRPVVTVSVKADGSFEFQSIPKGIYSASLRAINLRMGGILHWYVAVDNQDIHSLEFRHGTGPELEGGGMGKAPPLATGTVIVRDAFGKRIEPFPAGVLFRFMPRRTDGVPSVTSVGKDGSFSLLVSNTGTFSFVGLPPGHSIQAMTSNGTDLLKSPLVVEGRTPPAEIQVVLEYKRP
jgi:hypothetical protein